MNDSSMVDDSKALEQLFDPADVGPLKLRNSFVMAPMTRSRSPQATPTAEVVEYYRRRAAGGVGLIITEGVLVDHPTAGHDPMVPRLDENSGAGWPPVVDAIHAEDGLVLAQLWHLGGERQDTPGVSAWTPSGVPGTGSTRPHAMSPEDIDDVIAAFARSAAQARARGFDGVEIHGAHGYLIDEFLWSSTNRRTDDYGGSLENRARFPLEVVAAVRAATGPDFPIGFRFSQFKERDYGAHIAESPDQLGRVLAPIVEAGVDLLHASQRRFWEPAFDGSALNLAGWAKRLTGLPTITVGSIGLHGHELQGCSHPDHSLAALARRRARGEFDLIAIGRPLLANPTFVNQVSAAKFGELCDYHKDHESIWP